MIINSVLLPWIVKRIPYPIVLIERVRIGLDCMTWVRVTILGINFGIWKWSK